MVKIAGTKLHLHDCGEYRENVWYAEEFLSRSAPFAEDT
jgi:hypothetical protein